MYLCLITGPNVKNGSRKSCHWIYLRTKGRGKEINNVKTLLWLTEPPLSLYMLVFCVNNGGSVHSSPALLSLCPIFASSVFSSYHRRQQREKSSQTGKHKMSQDTPTTVPLSLLSTAAGSTSSPINVRLHS